MKGERVDSIFFNSHPHVEVWELVHAREAGDEVAVLLGGRDSHKKRKGAKEHLQEVREAQSRVNGR